MLMVAPKGMIKLTTDFLAESFLAHSILRGIVPTLDAEEKAKIIAGIIPLKKVSGDILPIVFTAMEYTITACKT